jgi:hypothetical protein
MGGRRGSESQLRMRHKVEIDEIGSEPEHCYPNNPLVIWELRLNNIFPLYTLVS